jgi:predicted dehydrogenase
MSSEENQPPIRAAIVGTGFIGPAHLEALRRNDVNVYGLVESSSEVCEAKARLLGIPHAYPSFEAMLDDPQIDIVHLATPNYLHFQHAKAALLAGKHVVCEKPLAMNSRQSAELVRLAAQEKRLNAVN